MLEILGNFIRYMAQPIVGILLGVWGVWIGVIHYYLGNSNGVVIMLVGISCLILASISINHNNYKKVLEAIKNDVEIKGTTPRTLDGYNYITK